jgi:hypothetical protein
MELSEAEKESLIKSRMEEQRQINEASERARAELYVNQLLENLEDFKQNIIQSIESYNTYEFDKNLTQLKAALNHLNKIGKTINYSKLHTVASKQYTKTQSYTPSQYKTIQLKKLGVYLPLTVVSSALTLASLAYAFSNSHNEAAGIVPAIPLALTIGGFVMSHDSYHNFINAEKIIDDRKRSAQHFYNELAKLSQPEKSE